MQHALSLLSFLHKVLNCWQYESSDITVIEVILLVLKIVTESYLEDFIAVTDLAVLFLLTQFREQLLKSVFSIADFKCILKTLIAEQTAARANEIDAYHYYSEKDHCNGEDVSQLILTVNYSWAVLTAMLWLENADIFEECWIWHNVNLSRDALYRCQHLQSKKPCYEQLTEMLYQIVKMPLEDIESDISDMIEDLILLSERATNEHLKEILQQMLQKQTVLISIANSEWEKIEICNSVFAALRDIAETFWQRQKKSSAKNDL